MATLTLLIPVRNAASTLDQALGSLRSQTFTDWDAIVVDDASTDATPRLLAAWTRKDERFRVVTNRAHSGIIGSLSRALALCRSPIAARMDADDCCLPRRLEAQLARLERGDVAAVGCRVRYFAEGGIRDGSRRYQDWLNGLVTPEEHDRDIFVECPIAHPTLLIRTEVLRAVGGYRDCDWPEDYDLCLRLWQAGHRMAKVDDVLFLWRDHPDRASRSLPEYQHASFVRLKAHFLARTLLRNRSALIFGAGPVGKAIARALIEEKVAVTGFVDLDPNKIGQSIYGVPVLSQGQADTLRGTVFGLGAVGQPGAREALRSSLATHGWVECRDYRCVA